eukprot:GABV01009477.1.p1 GENE.GABV01009477.1~~GABV01009477.1.p1  ORF type:complete len:181 (-),score=33.50 GABV01009477.1:80-622(-)
MIEFVESYHWPLVTRLGGANFDSFVKNAGSRKLALAAIDGDKPDASKKLLDQLRVVAKQSSDFKLENQFVFGSIDARDYGPWLAKQAKILKENTPTLFVFSPEDQWTFLVESKLEGKELSVEDAVQFFRLCETEKCKAAGQRGTHLGFSCARPKSGWRRIWEGQKRFWLLVFYRCLAVGW